MKFHEIFFLFFLVFFLYLFAFFCFLVVICSFLNFICFLSICRFFKPYGLDSPNQIASNKKVYDEFVVFVLCLFFVCFPFLSFLSFCDYVIFVFCLFSFYFYIFQTQTIWAGQPTPNNVFQTKGWIAPNKKEFYDELLWEGFKLKLK